MKWLLSVCQASDRPPSYQSWDCEKRIRYAKIEKLLRTNGMRILQSYSRTHGGAMKEHFIGKWNMIGRILALDIPLSDLIVRMGIFPPAWRLVIRAVGGWRTFEQATILRRQTIKSQIVTVKFCAPFLSNSIYFPFCKTAIFIFFCMQIVWSV